MKADRAKLLESSITIKSNLERQVQELRSQLEAEKKRVEEVWEELEDSEEARENLRSENLELKKTCDELRSEVSGLEKKLTVALAKNEKSAPVRKDFLEAADLLNQLKKAKGKKSSATLADVESILEILEES